MYGKRRKGHRRVARGEYQVVSCNNNTGSGGDGGALAAGTIFIHRVQQQYSQ